MISFLACSKDEKKKFVNQPPEDLSFYIINDSTAILTWNHSSNAISDDFLYYQVFSSNNTFPDDESLDTVGISDPLITRSDSVEVPIERLIRKHVMVKTVLNRQDQHRFSERSNLLVIAAPIFGIDTVWQVELGGDYHSGLGFNLTTGATSYSMNTPTPSLIDFFFSSDSIGNPVIKSPSMYNSYYNVSYFKLLSGETNWLRYSTSIENFTSTAITLPSLKPTFVVKTLNNHYAKVSIEQINSEPGTDFNSAIIKYSYQPIVGFICF